MMFLFDGRLAIGIGLSEAIILTYFAQRPGSLQNCYYESKSSLWRDLPFSSTMTVERAMKRLEKARYINVIPSNTSKRGFKVVLTAQGMGALSDPWLAHIND